MTKAVSSNGSSLAVRIWAKTSLISSRALASQQLQLGSWDSCHYATFQQGSGHPQPPHVLYTAGDNLQCGYGTRDARTLMIQPRRSGQDNLHPGFESSFF